MRRVFWSLVGAATLVSLMLCAATVLLWVRGFWCADIVWRGQPGSEVGVFSSSGSFSVSVRHWTPASGVPPEGWETFIGSPKRDLLAMVDEVYGVGHLRWGGFASARSSYSSAARTDWSEDFVAPDWAVVAVLGVLPVGWGVRWWRRRAPYGPGRCQRCGYDLRATPERCPECGARGLG